MANFIVLPMAFLSGSFFPLDGSPHWLQDISQALPLRHLNDGMLDVMVRGEPWRPDWCRSRILAGFAVVDHRAGRSALPAGRPRSPGSSAVDPWLTFAGEPAPPDPAAALSRLHRTLRPDTPSPLLGATVLVTGASSGIGEAHGVRRSRPWRPGAAGRPPRRASWPASRAEIALGAVAPRRTRVRPDRRRGRRRARRGGAHRARRGRLPRQQRRPVDPPLARAQPRPLPRLRADDGGQLLRPGAAHDGAAAGDARAAVRARGQHRHLGRCRSRRPSSRPTSPPRPRSTAGRGSSGREAYVDNVTCTNMRVALVATAMVGPTEAYSGRRAESPSTAPSGSSARWRTGRSPSTASSAGSARSSTCVAPRAGGRRVPPRCRTGCRTRRRRGGSRKTAAAEPP